MSADLRIGIIGFGRRAKLFAHAHHPGAGSRVTAVCEPLADRRAVAAERFGVDTYLTDSITDLLRQPLDAVGVFTEDHRHAGMTVQCLAAGVPTFVEKPLAITVADCDRVLGAARDHRTPLYVGHNMRHFPLIRLMWSLISAGEIGAVKLIWCRHFVGYGGDYYFKDWHAERRNVGSLLLQKGAHDIDVIHWLAGSRTNRVNAMGALTLYDQVSDRHDGTGLKHTNQVDESHWPPLSQQELSPYLDVEDVNHVNLALDNGTYATYQQCHYTPDNWRNYTVIGTEGRLENFGDRNGSHVKIWNRRTTYNGDADKVVQTPAAPGGHGGSDPQLVREFLEMVRTGARPAITPIEARDAVAAGLAAAHSVRHGGIPVDVPPVAEDLAAYWRC